MVEQQWWLQFNSYWLINLSLAKFWWKAVVGGKFLKGHTFLIFQGLSQSFLFISICLRENIFMLNVRVQNPPLARFQVSKTSEVHVIGNVWVSVFISLLCDFFFNSFFRVLLKSIIALDRIQHIIVMLRNIRSESLKNLEVFPLATLTFF